MNAILPVTVFLLGLFSSFDARAQVFDARAQDKVANEGIQQAITGHYLATDFAGAEAALEQVLKSCEGKCSLEVRARAWMYLGIVRGSGKQDLATAKEAFVQAVTLFRAVKLDRTLATPELKAAFDQIAVSQATAKATTEPTMGLSSRAVREAPIGGMTCAPLVSELQTHRVLPINCTTEEPATKAEIKYKEFGGTQWKIVQMAASEGKWIGAIPCSATSLQGNLLWYVNAKDQSGEVIDNFATQRQPILVEVVENTSEAPPSFPGKPVPVRCGVASDCPEEMLGTPACPGTVARDLNEGSKSWGDACGSNDECGSGLYCQNGSCSSLQSCERDRDCTSRKCVEFLCAPPGEEDKGVEHSHRDTPLNWIGLHLGVDVASVSSKNVCQSGDFVCLYESGVRQGTLGESFVGTDTSSGEIEPGFAVGTVRLLASYERVLMRHLGAEARLGLALGGAPKTGTLSFFPLHVEGRAKYWFTGNPASGAASPYLFAGGGVAQVDAKVDVIIRQNIEGCNADADCQEVADVRAYKRMGAGFVSAGGGAVIPFGQNIGLSFNLSAMLMLPKSGLVFEPALGLVYGF